jgi:hypothetical protein
MGRSAALLAPLLGALMAAVVGTALAQDSPQSIETPGRAKFQICRSWVMFTTCNEYGRVDIPAKVALRDVLHLNFGSNPKSMAFPVVAIRLTDGVCTLYTEPPSPGTDESSIDKLTVPDCTPAQ